MTTNTQLNLPVSQVFDPLTLAERDTNANLLSNRFVAAYTTTVTAGATTTLTLTSTFQQYFTGSTTQTVVMPVTSLVRIGDWWLIVNNSSGVVTVQSSGGNTIQAMAANTAMWITCILNSGTTAASWSTIYNGSTIDLPSGTQFNTQQGQFTTSTSSSSASFVDTGITVSITPTSASNTVLVRAVVQVCTDAAASGMFQLVRGSTPIGIGTSVGSRDAVGAAAYGSNVNSMVTVVMEWLDSPATTSATTYKVQYAKEGGTGNVYINRSATDTNAGGNPRTASTITVNEVHA